MTMANAVQGCQEVSGLQVGCLPDLYTPKAGNSHGDDECYA